MVPGSVFRLPGVAKTVNRNVLWFPEAEIQDPRSYIGCLGAYVAPGSCFFAPRNRNKAPGSNITPMAKTCIPRADRAVTSNVDRFLDSDGE